MPYPVIQFANQQFDPLPAGARRAGLLVAAPYPVLANAGVGAFSRQVGTTEWTKLPAGGIDNSSDTTTPDRFEVDVQAGFEYAFTFKGQAVAVAPGANAVSAGFTLYADDVVPVSDLGGVQKAKGSAAGIVGAAYFRT